MCDVSSGECEAAAVYEQPSITTYTAEQLLELIGPVQAGSDPGGTDNFLGAANSNGSGYYAPEENWT